MNNKLGIKYVSISLIVILIMGGLPFILDFTAEHATVKAATIIVDKGGGGNYTTIQAAINAANPGDTIYVWAGTYNENVVINKKLTLIGNGTTNTTIHGGGGGDVVQITSDWVNVTGFTITNSGNNWGDAGIEIASYYNCKIEYCNCSNNDRGIYLSSSSSNTLVNNTCNSNNDRGIYLDSSSSNTLMNNTCSNNDYGIYMYSSSSYNTLVNNTCNSNNNYGIYLDYSTSYNTLVNNTCNSNNDYGIYLDSSSSNTLMNNTCSNNNYGIYLSSSSSNTLMNNTCSNNNYGIGLYYSSSNTLANNNCNSNNYNGIYLPYSSSNTLMNNTCNSNNDYGIGLSSSSSNTLMNNTCSNNYYGIQLYGSSSNTLMNNTCSSNSYYGIGLYSSSSYNTLENNTCNSNNHYGIRLDSSSSYNTLENNTCNSNNWYGIYLYSSSSYNTLVNNTCSNNWYGIYLSSSSSNTLVNNTCTSNNYGIFLSSSSSNIIENCSLSSQTVNDFFIRFNSIKNIAINTSFNTIHIDLNSQLIVKDYLHIQVNDSSGAPLQGADVEVEDNSNVIYASSGYGGTAPQTNTIGQIKWLLVTDRIYNASITPTQNTTTVNIKFNDLVFRYNNRDINMAISHFEYFIPDILPSKPILQNPNNNSYTNDSTPGLKWNASTDDEGDPLTYFFEIAEADGDWISLVEFNHTLMGVLNWNVSQNLTDGVSYQWRVRANDGHRNGTWSKVWKFTIDTDLPIGNKPSGQCIFNNSGTINWSWTPSLDTGSGIIGYYVYIDTDTIPYTNDVLNGAWTTNNWYEISGLKDGRTYYCKIKARNGAGTIGNYSLRSDGIVIDLDMPLAHTPIDPGDYNNTGTIKWSWGPSSDTGSGILGYYICIGTTPGGNDVLNDVWTTNTWYELSGLVDGKTYYCKIKTKNGAGTIGGYSDNSDGILVDIDMPITNTPISPVKYNNTGTVKWTWAPSIDTGSGIVGYYVCIGTTSGGNDVIDDDFKIKHWYKLSRLSDGITYYCKIKAQNGAGTIGDYSSNSAAIMVDTSAPTTVLIFINYDNEYINSTSVTLSITAEDTGSGLDSMRFSTNAKTWSAWETYKASKEYTLPSGDGLKTVYCEVQDQAGNIALHVSDSIFLDTTPPRSLSILIENGAPETDSITVRLKLNAIDDISSVFQMVFSNDGINWSDWEQYETTKLYTLSTGDGPKIVYFKVKDYAGNIAEPVSDNIILITDNDRDGMPDQWEEVYGLNTNLNDANRDPDKDGLSNIQEYNEGTNPQNLDTDNDGLSDEDEIKIYHTNATNPDTDEDGYIDGIDTYPLDPSKWEKGDESTDKEDFSSIWVLLAITVIIIIVLIAFIFLFVLKPKKLKKDNAEKITAEKQDMESKLEQPLPPPEQLNLQLPRQPPKPEIEPVNIKNLARKGSQAYSEGRYEDAIIVWQHVLEKEPGKHSEIKKAIEDAIGKIKNGKSSPESDKELEE